MLTGYDLNLFPLCCALSWKVILISDIWIKLSVLTWRDVTVPAILPRAVWSSGIWWLVHISRWGYTLDRCSVCRANCFELPFKKRLRGGMKVFDKIFDFDQRFDTSISSQYTGGCHNQLENYYCILQVIFTEAAQKDNKVILFWICFSQLFSPQGCLYLWQ